MNSQILDLLTSDRLAAIERMAAAAFTAEEIEEAILLPGAAILMNDEENYNPARAAYRKGYLERALELRERIFTDAKNGSSPAQNIAYKLLEDVAIKSRL
jgi:hypothetical protein